MSQTITIETDHPTVRLAATELARYLSLGTGETWEIARTGAAAGIRLRTMGAGLPAVEDPARDDAVHVDVTRGAGTITGTNPRAVLLAVYRFLRRLGYRWVRPGPEGEVVPRLDPAQVAATFTQRASYRHRGICIEGAVSLEHVLSLIEWMPKVGLNAYFTQFREAFTFFDRWYSHRDNPLRAPEGVGLEQIRGMVRQVEAQIALRGLLFHAVGHGWTCEPFGVPGLGWDRYQGPVPERASAAFALVNGKRELWHGVPLDTNLCYGNPAVRRTMVEDIVRYLREHPAVDYLHLWLADGSNNQCECELCTPRRPADHYVRLLNELDTELEQAGLTARIVFLVYVDLYWPPETERIRNQDRFVLMFAPITRTYSAAFAPRQGAAPLPPYTRNRLVFPSSIEENLAFLAGWQSGFRGDSFDFDYHWMWDHYTDPGYVSVSRGLHADLSQLERVGLNGYVSCQVQRAFFPTGLGMYVLGETLWDREARFETLAREYFHAAFGEEGPGCRRYLEELGALFDPPWLRGEKPAVDPARHEALERVPGVVAAFLPTVERGMHQVDPTRAASWRYLAAHGRITVALAAALASRAAGRETEMRERVAAWARLCWELEPQIHPALDVFEYQLTVRRRLGMTT